MASIGEKITNIFKKFGSKTTGDNGNRTGATRTASGEPSPFAELNDVLSSFQSNMLQAYAGLFVGKAQLGKNVKSFENTAVKIPRSILGEKNSIYKFLEDIHKIFNENYSDKDKQNNIRSLLKDIKKNTGDAADAIYLDSKVFGKVVVEKLKELVDNIDVLKDNTKDTNKSDKIIEKNVKVTIVGLDDKSTNNILKIAELDASKTDNSVEQLKNLLNVINGFNLMNPEDIKNLKQNINELCKVIPQFTFIMFELNLLSKLKFNNDRINEFITNMKTVVDGFNTIEPLKENVLMDIASLKKIVGTLIKFVPMVGILHALDDQIKTKDALESVFTNLNSIFIKTNQLNALDSDKITSITATLDLLNNMMGDVAKVLMKIWLLKKTVVPKNSKDNSITKVFDTLSTLFSSVIQIGNKKIDNIDKVNEGLNKILLIIQALKSFKLDKKVKSHLNDLTGLFVGSKVEKGASASLSELFKSVNKVKKPDVAKIKDIEASLKSITTIIGMVKAIASDKGKIDKLESNVVKYFEALDQIYIEADKRFAQAIAVSANADKATDANKKIKRGLESTEEIAVGSSKRSKDITKSQVSIKGLAVFMITAVAVMTIGALIIEKDGGKFIKNALKFGVVLGAFEALVIAPMLLFGVIQNDVSRNITAFTGFVIVASLVMMIGAAFVMLSNGRLVKAAFQFGMVLGIFEALVIAPFMMFGVIKAVLPIKGFASFIVTCVAIMMVGALFVELGGGKYLRSAIMFGLFLGLFEALVVAPFMLFGVLKFALDIKGFKRFILTCVAIMMIGALFMELGGGKMVKQVLAFGLLLMVFEIMVIAPFILFRIIGNEVMKGMRTFTVTVLTCTIILMIGALFMTMKGGKMWKYALEFTAVLLAFEIAVIAPFLLFNIVKRSVLSSIRDFALFMVLATACLLVGTLFMTLKNGTMWKYALEFTGIMALFVLAMSGIAIAVSAWMNPKTMGDIELFGLFVLECSLALSIGTAFVAKFGADSALLFGIILTGFVAAMGWVAVQVSLRFNPKTMADIELFGLFVLECSLALSIGTAFIDKYGTSSALIFAGILLGFVNITAIVAAVISKILKGDAIVKMDSFALFILASSGAMLLGAWFIENYGYQSVLIYAGILLGFITFASVILAVLTSIGPMISVGTATAIALGGSFLAITASIWIIDTLFANDKDGSRLTKDFLILGGLIALSVGVLLALGAMAVLILPGSLAALALGASMLVLSGSFAIIDAIASDESTIIDNIAILREVITKHVIPLYSDLAWSIISIGLGSAAATLMGISMLALGGAFGIVDRIFGGDKSVEMKNNITALNEVIAGENGKGGPKSLIYTYEMLGGPLDTFIIGLGSLSALAMAGSMLALGEAFGIIHNILGDGKAGALVVEIGLLNEILAGTNGKGDEGSLIYTYKILGGPLDTTEILLGAESAEAIGKSMMLLTASFTVIDDLLKDGRARSIIDNIKKLNELLAGPNGDGEDPTCLYKVYKLLDGGWFRNSLKEGASTAVAIGKSMKKLSESLMDANNAINEVKGSSDNDRNGLKHSLAYIISTIGSKEKSDENSLYKLMTQVRELPMVSGLIDATAMKEFSDKLGTVLNDIYKLVEGYNVLGKEVIEEGIGNFISSINKYLGIVEQLELPDLTDVMKLKWFMEPVNKILADCAENVANMASMKVANKWDANGSIIGYRELQTKDFDLANDNAAKLLLTMAAVVSNVWSSDQEVEVGGQKIHIKGISQLVNDPNNPIKKVVKFSQKISKMLGGIGEGVQQLATLQIPIDWNEDGNPIRFRTLRPNDFHKMGEGVKTLLLSITRAIIEVYDAGAEENGENIFEKSMISVGKFKFRNPNPFAETKFEKVMKASFKISDLLGSIGQIVKDLAVLQIPIDWDDNGNPISYRTLTSGDFEKMGKGVGSILTSIMTALGNLYNSKTKDGTPMKQMFDEVEGGIKKLIGGSSPMSKVIKTSFKITELLGNMGESISHLGALQIPIDWDEKGKPIEFRDMDQGDFDRAGQAVSTLMTFTLNALAEVAPKLKDEKIQDIIDSTKPLSEFIGNMSESLIMLASAQVPDNWDKEGKPIHYQEINAGLMGAAGATVGFVVTAIAQMLINTFSQPKYEDFLFVKDGDKYKPTGKLQHIVESVSGITKIVSDITDSVVKIAQAQIPTKWDKDGKPIWYEKINIDNIPNQLNNVIRQIVLATTNAIVFTYLLNKPMFDDDENSPLQIAVKAITGVTKIVGDITDDVIKIAQCLVPDVNKGFDENGKPKGWKQLNVDEVVGKVEQMLAGNDGQSGLLTVALKSMETIYNQYFSDNGVFKDNTILESISNAYAQIDAIIGKASKRIVNIATTKIPTGYNAKGEATGYTIINDEIIGKAKENIINIMTAFADVFADEKITELSNNTNVTKIGTMSTNLTTIMTDIGSVIENVLTKIQMLTKNNKKIEELFNIPSKAKTQNSEVSDIPVGVLRDIYAVIYSIDKLISVLNNMTNVAQSVDFTKIDLISENISLMLDAYDEIVASIDSFVSNTKILNNQSITTFLTKDKTGKYILVSTLESISSIYSKINDIFANSFDSLNNAINYNNLQSYKTGIRFLNYTMEDIFKNFENIVSTSGTVINKLSTDNNPILDNLHSILVFYSKALSELNLMFETINGTNQIDTAQNLIKLSSDLKLIANTMGLLFNNMADTYTVFYNSIDKFNSSISAIIEQFNVSDQTLSIAVDNLKENMEKLVGIYNLELKKETNGYTIFTYITNDLYRFIKYGIGLFDERMQYQNNMLIEAIKDIHTVMNSQKVAKVFKENTDTLTRYVKVLNSIKVNNVNSLTKLIQELSLLGRQLGGVDGLTSAIADKLSVVLQELVIRLEESYQAITTAEEVQEKRHKLINESVEKVKNMLAQPLAININADGGGGSTDTSQSTDTNTTDLSAAGGGNTTSTTNSGTQDTGKKQQTPNNTQKSARGSGNGKGRGAGNSSSTQPTSPTSQLGQGKTMASAWGTQFGGSLGGNNFVTNFQRKYGGRR